jgi:hypothetical protein
MLFRDHHLSDLIGFAYQSWDATAATADFLSQVRDAGRRFSEETGGEVGTVVVILDGENAWEHYSGGGRPFLRALYQALQDATDIQTVTMTDAATAAAQPLPEIFPGSWINGDFYIWAGHRDDHRAWGQLAAARRAFDQLGHAVEPAARERARDELLIAEGSDWFWWYGDDHSSDHDRDFDDLFRRHLRNVYRALGQPAPDDLHVTNITTEAPGTGPITFGVLTSPAVDGRSRDYTQWASAALVPLGVGGGTMHRVAAPLVRALRVAADRDHLFLRVDGAELVRRWHAGDVRLVVLQDRPRPVKIQPAWVAVDVLTAAIPFAALEVQPGERTSLSLLVTDAAGHVIEHHPSRQPFEVDVPGAAHDAVNWIV